MSSARASRRICLYSFSSFAERRVLIAAICASVGPSSRGFSTAAFAGAFFFETGAFAAMTRTRRPFTTT